MLRLSTFLFFMILLFGAGPVTAQDNGAVPEGAGADWQATYWGNVALSGRPAFTRREPDLYWNWGRGGPEGTGSDYFSARWTRTIVADAGTYRFTATADDGIRVWVDEELIIDEWRDQTVETFNADVILDEGLTALKVEYFEGKGLATVQLSWKRAADALPAHGWRAEYYAGLLPAAAGTQRLVREDAAIGFDWGYGPPAPGVPADQFSVRWRRLLDLQPGLYRFNTQTDDGVRLYVDGQLLIDAWVDQPDTTHSATIRVAGPVPVQMDYYENTGRAAAQLWWQRLPAEPVPDAVSVHVFDSGFSRGGPPGAWQAAQGGSQGSGYLAVPNLAAAGFPSWAGSPYNWGRWYPDVPAGRYAVSVFVPLASVTGNTQNAHYWVSHAGGYTLRTIDQSANAMQWVTLGTFTFRGDHSEYVGLSNITGEPTGATAVLFDAVRWEAHP